MPARRRTTRRARVSLDQRAELWLGPELALKMARHPSGATSLFHSEAHRRAAWESVREELNARWRPRAYGVRPWGFWVYDAERPDLAASSGQRVERAEILAAGGWLEPEEITGWLEQGDAAAARLGTDAQQSYRDEERAAVAAAIRKHLPREDTDG